MMSRTNLLLTIQIKFTSMPDVRVLHFWDGERVIGQWIAQKIDGYDGISWDSYYLFGPEATWKTVPSPLVSSGRTPYEVTKSLLK